MSPGPTPDFEKWAKGFAGCDGGGLQKNGIWFCGIEWGRSVDEETLRADLKLDVSRPDTFNEKFLSGQLFGGLQPDGKTTDGRSYTFNRIMAKLLAVILGKPLADYKRALLEELSPRPFTPESTFLKLNLYPLACHRTAEWYPHYRKLTGFESKATYYDWCRRNRFETFRQLTSEWQPRLVIGCETGRRAEFLAAFGGLDEEVARIAFRDTSGLETGHASLHRLRSRGHLVVTPFFGGRHSALKFDANIELLGKWIAASANN